MFGRAASVALSIGAVCGIGLVVAGFLAPVYQSQGTSFSGKIAHDTDTLVGVNGPAVVVVLAVPFLVTVLVACALMLRERRGAVLFAWALTGMLAAFNLLAMMTIGVFIVPVTAALIVACATCRPRPGTRDNAEPSTAAP